MVYYCLLLAVTSGPVAEWSIVGQSEGVRTDSEWSNMEIVTRLHFQAPVPHSGWRKPIYKKTPIDFYLNSDVEQNLE